MLNQNAPETEGPRRWFLDAPEANIMTSERERELLLELLECKDRLVRATRRPDGTEWSFAFPDAEFQRVVHNLAGDASAAVEVRALARRYEEIRTALSMANSRLVAHIAKRDFNRGISAADLIQEGFCGLLAAIDRFDTANTTRLATYAGFWISQAMQRAIAGGAYAVRLNPKQLQRLTKSIPKPEGPGNDKYGESDFSTSHRAGADRPDLAPIRPKVSLDAPCRSDDSTPLANMLASRRDSDSDEKELAEFLGKIFEKLNAREILILKLRFGLEGETRQSLSEISQVLGISKERVRQLEERALQKMRGAADGSDFIESGPDHRAKTGPLVASPVRTGKDRTRERTSTLALSNQL